MARDLQSIVDSLSSRLSRSVLIDDPHLRLRAYSSHFGSVDSQRVAAITRRKAKPKAIEWVNRHGVRDAIGPVRVPPNPAIDMDARVCVPIRFSGELLAYIWLIDPDQSLTPANLKIAQAAADAAAEAIHLEGLLDQLQGARERELLRDLLSDQDTIRRHAADELVEENLFIPSRGSVVIAMHLGRTSGPIEKMVRLPLIGVLDQVRQSLTPRHALHLVRPDHALLVMASEDPVLRIGGINTVAQRLLEIARTKLARRDVVVGIGDVRSEIFELATSYERARQAARVAEVFPTFGPIAAWDDLGIYRTLVQFPLQLNASVVHPGLPKLINDRTNENLARTLETFLDEAGNATRTAAALGLHRTTLYYRLEKIEELTGADLESGAERLALHLGLKLARLAGLYPEQHGQGALTVRPGSKPPARPAVE